jgi:hypothetical protein
MVYGHWALGTGNYIPVSLGDRVLIFWLCFEGIKEAYIRFDRLTLLP